MDIRDSVGILDSYFPQTEFFINADEFENYIKGVDYLVICTPNHTHKEYMEIADRIGAEAICEKPLVVDYNDISQINRRHNVILQMREDEITVKKLKELNGDISIYYSTPRGSWYDKSWKGNQKLSGGLLLNIGIHLFDLAIYCYGKPIEQGIYFNDNKTAFGYFTVESGRRISWRLSIEEDKKSRQINGIEIGVNPELHRYSYRRIMRNEGWHPEDILPAMGLVNEYKRVSENLFAL